MRLLVTRPRDQAERWLTRLHAKGVEAQALPLIESGAADRYAVTAAEIALACASHNGEPRHVALVQDWLRRIGCSVAAGSQSRLTMSCKGGIEYASTTNGRVQPVER